MKGCCAVWRHVDDGCTWRTPTSREKDHVIDLDESRLTKEQTVTEKVSPVVVRSYDRSGLLSDKTEWVIKEQPVTLYLNGSELVTLLCAGHHLDELVVGFLHAEGFLETLSDLVKLHVDEESGKVEVTVASDVSLANQMWQKRTVTSGCGKGSLFYFSLDALLSRPVPNGMTIPAHKILGRVDDLNRFSEIYRRTHGVHNTALAGPDELVLFRDDIGRHNAVDMIVGHCLFNGIPLENKFLLTTGRLTSEILIKVAKVGLPVIVSRNTATSLAIELARSLNITLIGYARAGKFVVYAGEHRIV